MRPTAASEESSAYCVAVNAGEHRLDRYATSAAPAIAPVRFSAATQSARAKITKAKISSAKGRARFTFISSGGGNGFQCALVRRHKKKTGKKPKPSFSACKSPKRYKNLTPGKYTFEVRALSSAGAGPAAKRGFAI